MPQQCQMTADLNHPPFQTCQFVGLQPSSFHLLDKRKHMQLTQQNTRANTRTFDLYSAWEPLQCSNQVLSYSLECAQYCVASFIYAPPKNGLLFYYVEEKRALYLCTRTKIIIIMGKKI